MSSSENLDQSGNSAVEDNVLTMLDVLKDEQDYEEDAHAVLGGSDEKNCSYKDGYVKRQALYSCVTCSTSENRAAVCLACSIACHKNHELIELYTKRNYRCDCGNSKFPNNPCRLFLAKDYLNENNVYNHNFEGKYCTCEKPYPDPDDEEDDIMLQCIACEDWFHGRHLEGEIPTRDFDEIICKTCMEKLPFLWYYNRPDLNTSSNEKVDVVNDSIQEADASKCILEEFKKEKEISDKTGPAFWYGCWRRTLCHCESCLNVYKTQGCEYLLSQDDTVKAYEEKGLLKQPTSQYDQGMNALQHLDRVEQIEAIHGYNEMASEFKDFCKRFAENKAVVKEEDIKEFFSHMQARKRPRLDLPQFCS